MRGITPLLGCRVTQVFIRHPTLRWPIPPHLTQSLVGLSLSQLSRRAKYILIRFSDASNQLQGTLILHLGMSGRLCLLEKDVAPAKHDHFDIQFSDGRLLRLRDPRRFGAVLWVPAAERIEDHPLINRLGPEPLQPEFNGVYLYQQTRSRSAPIKTTIMDGHLVVGVGNIYASESLFRARIHPKTAANKLSLVKCERLVEEIKLTLAAAIEAGGSSLRDFFGADGNPGYFQQNYFVYARSDAPCQICGHPIKQIKQGQRSTFYCAKCQH